MRFRKVNFKRVVFLVKAVFFEVAAQVASQMQLVQVLFEGLHIVEELFAKVTPRMWQDFCTSLCSEISVFNVGPQFANVVDTLLADENGASF